VRWPPLVKYPCCDAGGVPLKPELRTAGRQAGRQAGWQAGRQAGWQAGRLAGSTKPGLHPQGWARPLSSGS
jgi:hypothetical protein